MTQMISFSTPPSHWVPPAAYRGGRDQCDELVPVSNCLGRLCPFRETESQDPPPQKCRVGNGEEHTGPWGAVTVYDSDTVSVRFLTRGNFAASGDIWGNVWRHP